MKIVVIICLTFILAAIVYVSYRDYNNGHVRVEEAKTIVRLYEVRLFNIRLKAAQEDLKFNEAKANYEQLLRNPSAVSEKTLRLAKLDYDWWVLQDRVKDIEEAEIEVELAKQRLKLVEAGVYVHNLPIKQINKD